LLRGNQAIKAAHDRFNADIRVFCITHRKVSIQIPGR
jgi:hypothetical protein